MGRVGLDLPVVGVVTVAPVPSRSRTDPTGCWPWLASKGNDGYGQFNVSRKNVKAHRFAYSRVNGPIPAGLFVCHHCDNKECCNPAHLFLGTPASNSADMSRKGRQANAKLTPDQVREILAASGTQREIALRFGIHQTNVSHIKTGKAWKHLNRTVVTP